MCGITSRRKADQLVREGRININGLVVKELGYRVNAEDDKVEIGSKVLKPERKRYLVLNKPRFYLTTLRRDKEGKRTIRELIKDIPERVYPVGRLDYNTEGLLILTNDGELANGIIHPRYKLPKIYLAIVKGRVKPKTREKMIIGARLEDGFAIPDNVKIMKCESENTLLEITFHEGRNHLVKRFLLRFEHPVLKLKRTAVGPIKLEELPRGKRRDMTNKELSVLSRAIHESPLQV
jgi:23S rRNA pseudouridine2605 synthase